MASPSLPKDHPLLAVSISRPPLVARPDPHRKAEEYMTTFMEARTGPFGELLAAGGALIKVPSVPL